MLLLDHVARACLAGVLPRGTATTCWLLEAERGHLKCGNGAVPGGVGTSGTEPAKAERRGCLRTVCSCRVHCLGLLGKCEWFQEQIKQICRGWALVQLMTQLWGSCVHFLEETHSYLCPCSCGLSVYRRLGTVGDRYGLFEMRILVSNFRVNLLWGVEIGIAGCSLLWHCWLQLPGHTATSGTPEEQDFHTLVLCWLRPETSEIIGQ